MLTLRTAIGLTQTGLADHLGVSRRSVGEWESGSSYPKVEHLKNLITLAVEQRAFPAGREIEAIRSLWEASQQKVLLDEAWLTVLLTTQRASAMPPNPLIAEPTGNRVARRTEPHRVSNLPFQPTPFVGREAELAQVADLVGNAACRLLTLLGPGGTGKTRLALEVTARQAEGFADGVVFVPLAPLDTAQQIISALADALDITFAGEGDPVVQLLDYLKRRHMLLVLDNFEHLLDGADLVNNILQRASRVKILATSRIRLNVQAEWVFDVEGLSYPNDHSTADSVTDLRDYSAVQLFVQRVTQLQSGIPLPEAHLTSVVNICRYVAGMPLAIELAAAGIRLMPITTIEARIQANLDVLATTLRDVPVRHRSMRAVFDHSWHLLSEPEQAVFAHLAVFRGGCTVDAAQQVAGAAVWSLLALVDKSLLRQINPQTGAKPGVGARFALLEPIREYALERLTMRGEMDALRRSHAAYYLSLAETAAAQWDSPTAYAATHTLDDEYDNLRTALQWYRDSGEVTAGLQLGIALGKFWRRRGYYSEGRVWLEELLARAENTADPTTTIARLRATHTAAWMASDQHDYERAAQLYEQSAQIGRTLGETEGEIHMLGNAARQARAAGQYQQAIWLFEAVVTRFRATGNRGSLSDGGLGNSLYELALVLREQGGFQQAAALFEECIALHQELGDREGLAAGLIGLSDVARDQGDAGRARLYGEQSLALARELGLQWVIGFSLNNLAVAAYLDGDLAGAAAFVQEGITLFRGIRSDSAVAELLTTLGEILRQQGALTAARNALTEALRHASVLGPRLLVAAAFERLASVLLVSEQAALGIQLLASASTLRAEMTVPVRAIDQLIITQGIETAQSVLGTKAFDILWAEAAELPLETVIDRLLRPPQDGVIPQAGDHAVGSTP